MRILRLFSIAIMSVLVLTAMSYSSCNEMATANQPTSISGVTKTTVHVETNPDGTTVEQNNVKNRLMLDNKPGSVKYLYVVSNYSGQVMFYSTVKGKVTSSGKRLTPVTVAVSSGEYNSHDGIDVDINGRRYQTGEVLQDDGTYGSSIDYIYWFDSRNIYRQLYPSAGTTIMVSETPVAFKSIIMNLENIDNK